MEVSTSPSPSSPTEKPRTLRAPHHRVPKPSPADAIAYFPSATRTHQPRTPPPALVLRTSGTNLLVLQSLFWENLAPVKESHIPSSGPLFDAVKASFGSFEALQKASDATALGIQGSGCVSPLAPPFLPRELSS